MMCDRQKIHVFLGPPPSSDSSSVPNSCAEGERRPPAGWRQLEFTWLRGRLRPASVLSHREGEERSTTLSGVCWELDRTRDAERAGPDCTVNSEQDSVHTGDGRAAGRCLSRNIEPGPENEDRCSATLGEYLDGCFPTDQPEPDPVPPPSAHTQYLSTWTLSQAVVLRGRCGIQSATSPEKTPPFMSTSTPELFSPTASSSGTAAQLLSQTCPTPKAKEGGVVLEATTEGVLCSQEIKTTSSSPARSPSVKKARLSEEPITKVSEVGSKSTTPKLQALTTLLVQCDKAGVRYSVLVAVVHPCHLKEVKVKSGPSAGTFVPLASIVVTDQSNLEMKVVLWRRAAFWALTVRPGDVLLITGLQLNEDRWRGETVLQSSFGSKLLNLGQITALTSPSAPQNVDPHSLRSLCGFLQKRRPLLLSLTHCPPQDPNRLPYTPLRSLRANTLVHAVLRVTHTYTSAVWWSEADSRCKSVVREKVVLTVEQGDGHQGELVLWGAAVDWMPRFSKNRAAVWDFRVLLVREGLTSDLLELHSTPWSSIQCLEPTDRRVLELYPQRPRQTGNGSGLELDLETLLSQKYSGEVELRVHVISFHFQDSPTSQNAPHPTLVSSTPLAEILQVLNGEITYIGCSRCCTELDTDANGIYDPCYPCLPHTAVRHYYRPGVLTVIGRGSSQVCVQVPPVTVQTILKAPPDKLHRSSAPGSEVKHIQVAAERIQTLISLPRKTLIITVRSHFLCDENSVPISQELKLLDLQFPT